MWGMSGSGSSSGTMSGSPGNLGGPSRVTSTNFRMLRLVRRSSRMSPRNLLTISAPRLSSFVAPLICSLETRQSEPRMLTQAPPDVGSTMTPGPCHRPLPTRGCLQTKINWPSVKFCGVRCRARRDFRSRDLLSSAAQALVAACRSSSARLKSARGSSLRYIGSIKSSDSRELGRRAVKPKTRCIGENPERLL